MKLNVFRVGLVLLAALAPASVHATALNVIQLEHSIVLLSDGAYLGHDAKVGVFRSKIQILAPARAALGCSGNFTICGALSLAFSTKASTLENMVEQIPAIVREICSFIRDEGVKDGVRVLLAGYTSSGQAHVYEIVLNAGGAEFLTLPPGRSKFTPSVGVEDDARILAEIRSGAFARDPEAAGLRVIEMQRSYKITIKGWNGERGAHIVGGFAEAVTITRDAITEKILKQWPDEIGKEIHP